MSKSIIKNRIFFFLILNVFLSISSFAQSDIVGKWETRDIIGYTDVAEYSLIKEKEPDSGRTVTFNLDGTFSSGETMQCLTGCFAFTSGTYAIVDNDHIHLIVEDVRFVGLTCGMNKRQKEDFIKDLGVFYIYKEGDKIRLIPSSGVLQDDRDEMLYTQMADNFHKEWTKYDYVWQNTNGSNQQEIINDCIDSKKQIVLSNCKVVFSTKRDLEEFLILKDDKEFHYVIYDSHNKKVSLAYPKNKG